MVFFIVGLPGVLLALLMYTVKEPKRRGLITLASGKARQIPIREVFQYVAQNKTTFLCHNVGFALLSFSSYGTTSWIPSYLIRNFEWTRAQSGVVYGTMIMIFSTLGIVAGGWMADRLAARGRRDATMYVGFLVSWLWFPVGFYTLMPTAFWSMVMLAPALFLASAPFGVAPAAITQMMPASMRGQASAIYLFVVNLIGLGLGPTVIAMITDQVFDAHPPSVKYSIFIATMVAHGVAAIVLWFGMKAYPASLDRLKDWEKKAAMG
jgi:MFS family permease